MPATMLYRMTAPKRHNKALRRATTMAATVTIALGLGTGSAVAAPSLPSVLDPQQNGVSDFFDNLLDGQLPALPSPGAPAPAPAPEPAPAPAPAPAPEPAPAPAPAPAAEAPESPCPPSARACVDLANQTTWLQQDGNIIWGPVPMASGAQGYETTTGYLNVQRKVRDDWSIPYDAPMPYSVYFTNDGEAFHEGSVNLLSHGCIHLNHDDAVKYFETLQVGDGVYIW